MVVVQNYFIRKKIPRFQTDFSVITDFLDYFPDFQNLSPPTFLGEIG